MVKMLFAIAKDITKFFVEYAPIGFLLALLVTVGYLWYEGCWKAKKLNKKPEIQIKHLAGKAFFLFLLTLYAYVIIGITILSRSEGGCAICNTAFWFFGIFSKGRNYDGCRSS